MHSFQNDYEGIKYEFGDYFFITVKDMHHHECARVFNAMDDVFANTTERISSAFENSTEVLDTTVGNTSQHQNETRVDKSTLATVGLLASLALLLSVATFFAYCYLKNSHILSPGKNIYHRLNDEQTEGRIDEQY